MLDNKVFGKRIASLRKEQGMTQSQLAEKLNISNKAISRWETGEGFPEISLLTPLAESLGVTVDFLLNEEKSEHSTTDDTNNESDTKSLRNKFTVKKLAWNNLNGFNKLAYISAMSAFLALAVSAGAAAFIVTLDIIPTEQIISIIPLIVAFFSNLFPKLGFIAATIGLVLGLFGKIEEQNKVSIFLILLNLFVMYGLPILLFILVTPFH